MNTITQIIAEIHEKLRFCHEGAPADYIPELARVDPDLFGISMSTTDGYTHKVGDTEIPFTIQSVSKAFVYGLVLDDAGFAATEERVDLEPSGDAFNEISLDPVSSKPMNAMINAGAIAVTGLVPGNGVEERFAWLHGRLSAFAGRTLGFDTAVYESESATGHRNRAIAYLLRNGGVLGQRVDEDLDLYVRQCSTLVTCADLAVMGATLAHGGINPISGERILSEASVERVLSVMCSSGMYNSSGTWITQVGLPAKSGVGGGVVAVLPGQLSLAVYSPRLDGLGNSVRGVRVFRELSRRFNLHVFNTPTVAGQVVRRVYRLNESGSTRRWPKRSLDYLRRAGSSVAIVEIQGDLFFSAIEHLTRAMENEAFARCFIIDCSRVGLVDKLSAELLANVTGDLQQSGYQVIIVDPNDRFSRHDPEALEPGLQFVAELDVALEGIEYTLLRAAGFGEFEARVELADCDLMAGIDPDDLDIFESLTYTEDRPSGTVLCRTGDSAEALWVLLEGSVDVLMTSAPGRPPRDRIASLNPGGCVGEIALVDGSERSADVVATQDSTFQVLSRNTLANMEIEYPRLYAALLRNIMLINFDRIRRQGSTFANRVD